MWRSTTLMAGLLSAGLALPATAQALDLRALLAIPGEATGTAPAAPSLPRWSGRSGASGHPLMQADAISAAAANFRRCLERYWPAAARRGVPRSVFVEQVSGLRPDLRIMDLMDSQPEFTKAIWDYLDVLVTAERIADGRALLAKYRPIFDRVERIYGVDRHAIVAIWGVESNYGRQIGKRSVVRSTATLACIGRRQHYFGQEFLASLEILARGDLRPTQLKGSWAGAFGPTQFMPTAFKRFAVDFDGDGRRDVVDSMPDLIASTANNLKKDGWVSGHTWGYEVLVPRGFNFMVAAGRRQMTLHQWEHAGIRRVGGKLFPRPSDRAYLLLPAGARGPGFLMLHNFRVIMRYNPSEAYALAIGHLADRLRGGDAFVQSWPRDERVLTRAERLELQEHLVNHGYDIGTPDGRLGPRTRTALRHYQASIGAVPDGFASGSILDRLRRR